MRPSGTAWLTLGDELTQPIVVDASECQMGQEWSSIRRSRALSEPSLLVTDIQCDLPASALISFSSFTLDYLFVPRVSFRSQFLLSPFVNLPLLLNSVSGM